MDFKDILNSIKKNTPAPIYFITGDEPYYIDRIINLAEESLIAEQEKDFNLSVLYGKDSNGKMIVEFCKQYPLIGNRKLVIVKEAQEIKDKDWEGIEAYLKNPSPVCILFIAYKHKKPDGRLAWVKQMKDKAVYFESKEVRDYQLPAFIVELAKENKLKIEPEASLLMAEYIGNNLDQISNEIDKLKINLNDNDTIKVDQVRENIGISKEFNVFELQKAFNTRDAKKVYAIIKNMAEHVKSNNPVMVIGAMFNHFVKLWMTKQYAHKADAELSGIIKLNFASYLKDYREAAANYDLQSLENCIAILQKFDLKSKGVDIGHVEDEELLVDLAVQLINC